MMEAINIGVQNIIDGDGVAVSFTGMLIVFIALITISSAIAALPHFLVILSKFLPEKVKKIPVSQETDSFGENVIAAISIAHHHNRNILQKGV